MSSPTLQIYLSGKNRGPRIRILLMLLDGREHEMSEFYDYVADAVPPQIAIRAFHRNRKDAEELVQNDYDTALEEGRRICIKSSINAIRMQGMVDVQKPEKEPRPEVARSAGYHDIRKIRLRMTECGRLALFRGRGTLARVLAEMVIGLERGSLWAAVTYQGRAEEYDFLIPNNPALAGEDEQEENKEP